MVKLTHKFFCHLIFVLVGISLWGQDKQAPETKVFNVDDFPGDTDLVKIQTAFNAVREVEGEKILSFAKRKYIIRPTEFDTFDSVIGINGVKNLTIEGNGAILVAKDALECRKGYFFKIENFEKVTVKDLSLLHDPLPYVQGNIISVDQNNNYVKVKLDAGFDAIEELRSNQYSKLWCRALEKRVPVTAMPMNPSWMDVEMNYDGRIKATQTEDRTWEIAMGYFDQNITLNSEFNWKEGNAITIWQRAGQDGYCFESGKDLHVENVTAHTALHYAFKVRGVENVSIEKCKVTPVYGGLFSSSADGIDIQQSRNIIIKNCEIIATGDDAISFLNHKHGDNGYEFEKKYQPPMPETNDQVLIQSNYISGGNRNGILLLADNAEVLENKIFNIRQYGIKFTGNNTRISDNHLENIGSFSAYKHIQDELNTGIIGSDEWTQNNVSIVNNRIENWFNMPGVLLKSVKNAKVAGNTFLLENPNFLKIRPFNPFLDKNKAIAVTSGSFRGSEIPSSNILIRGNRIIHGSLSEVENQDAFSWIHDSTNANKLSISDNEVIHSPSESE